MLIAAVSRFYSVWQMESSSPGSRACRELLPRMRMGGNHRRRSRFALRRACRRRRLRRRASPSGMLSPRSSIGGSDDGIPLLFFFSPLHFGEFRFWPATTMGGRGFLGACTKLYNNEMGGVVGEAVSMAVRRDGMMILDFYVVADSLVPKVRVELPRITAAICSQEGGKGHHLCDLGIKYVQVVM